MTLRKDVFRHLKRQLHDAKRSEVASTPYPADPDIRGAELVTAYMQGFVDGQREKGGERED